MSGNRLGRRRFATALGSALVVTALGGCGGGIPADASVAEFCKAGETFARANAFDAGVEAADRLQHTGTPKGIPSDARDGFELVVRLITDAKDHNDLERRYKGLDQSEKKSVESLDRYITRTC